MKFISDQQRNQLLQNGNDENRDRDHYPVLKLLDHINKHSWLVIEMDPDDPDYAFVLHDGGDGFPMFRYLSFALLEGANKRAQVDISEDPSFIAKFPISVYAVAARQLGCLTDDEAVLLKVAEANRNTKYTCISLVVELDIMPAVDAFFSSDRAAATIPSRAMPGKRKDRFSPG